MRNPAPINHFPPTLFSPNRSPIYGEAHLFSQPASRLGTGNPSLHGQCTKAVLVSGVDRPPANWPHSRQRLHHIRRHNVANGLLRAAAATEVLDVGHVIP